ncbi:F-box/kelch-repeat protein At3g06240-like [Bidens hawaiensis]|uniref:F-box/kelch-repeat protein At3g06240-like n=1 Tax=Bidens hawaiensis TaxID=980011 RepID=UPI00404B3C91
MTVPRSCNFDPTEKFVMLASLDGLVCLTSKRECGKLAFWNPLTGAYKRLSAGPIDPFRITLNPIGFYMDSSNDYKLLYLIIGGQPYSRAYIYSHILDSWREFEFPVADHVWTNATFWGQCLYFNVKNMPTTRHSTILCFDVNTEKFRDIQCPVVPGGCPKHYCGSLVVLKGCIHFCVSYEILNMKHRDVWRMDGDGGWVKVAAFGRKDCIRRCVSIESIGNWVAIVVIEGKNHFRKMNAEDDLTRYWDFCSSRRFYADDQMIYVETLISPNLCLFFLACIMYVLVYCSVVGFKLFINHYHIVCARHLIVS